MLESLEQNNIKRMSVEEPEHRQLLAVPEIAQEFIEGLIPELRKDFEKSEWMSLFSVLYYARKLNILPSDPKLFAEIQEKIKAQIESDGWKQDYEAWSDVYQKASAFPEIQLPPLSEEFLDSVKENYNNEEGYQTTYYYLWKLYPDKFPLNRKILTEREQDIQTEVKDKNWIGVLINCSKLMEMDPRYDITQHVDPSTDFFADTFLEFGVLRRAYHVKKINQMLIERSLTKETILLPEQRSF